ncbi:MAG: hypothetical protein JO352_30650 [Chloroflexi bacterium]|nr:hypothetical protein [Chloroflexota bacterium]
MRQIIRLGVLSSALALAGIVEAVGPASADLSVTPRYEIEAKLQYCANGGTACVPATGAPDLTNLRFALLEAYRVTRPDDASRFIDRDNSFGSPEVLIAKCAGRHSMDANHLIHAITMTVNAGPPQLGTPGGQLDGGTVRGQAFVLGGSETNTRSFGNLTAEAVDPKTGDRATVEGWQIANNSSDTRVEGGFRITLTGPQYDEVVGGANFNPETAPPPTVIGQGTMTCNTFATPVLAGGAPPYFENETNDATDANS